MSDDIPDGTEIKKQLESFSQEEIDILRKEIVAFKYETGQPARTLDETCLAVLRAVRDAKHNATSTISS